jgi:hypothetical protein
MGKLMVRVKMLLVLTTTGYVGCATWCAAFVREERDTVEEGAWVPEKERRLCGGKEGGRGGNRLS